MITTKTQAISGVSPGYENIVEELYPSIAMTGLGQFLNQLYESIPFPSDNVKLSYFLFVPPTIPFAVTRESAVSLTVYDLLGRVVARPADGRYAPGAHAVAWDAHDRPAGVYVYEIRATPADGAPVIERKAMMLLR